MWGKITAVLVIAATLCNAGPINSPIINGVNLGGWLVLEQFLNPDLLIKYNMPDEFTYTQTFKNNATMIAKLHDHWATWIVEADVAKLAQIGFTHVRVPVPHWALETADEMAANGESYETGQWAEVTRVMRLLKQYNIKALIEIHSAVGSQNGWDNSGYITATPQFGVGDSVQKQITLTVRLAQWIAAWENDSTINGTVWALGILNEPFSWGLNGGIGMIKNFYLNVYGQIRQYLPAERYAIVMDHAFQPNEWYGFMDNQGYQNVILDVHIYHCFDAGLRNASYTTHAQVACGPFQQQVTNQSLPTIVGEWSVAYKTDSIFAGTEPYPTIEQQNWMFEFALLQMATYRANFFWNFKTPSAPFWDYFLGWDNGWLPSLPLTDAQANNNTQCNRQAWGPYPDSQLVSSSAVRPPLQSSVTPPQSTSYAGIQTSNVTTSTSSTSSSTTSSSTSSSTTSSSTTSSTSSSTTSSSTTSSSAVPSSTTSSSVLPSSTTSSSSESLDPSECSETRGSISESTTVPVDRVSGAETLRPLFIISVIFLATLAM